MKGLEREKLARRAVGGDADAARALLRIIEGSSGGRLRCILSLRFSNSWSIDALSGWNATFAWKQLTGTSHELSRGYIETARFADARSVVDASLVLACAAGVLPAAPDKVLLGWAHQVEPPGWDETLRDLLAEYDGVLHVPDPWPSDYPPSINGAKPT